MSVATTTRMSAEERREAILEVARDEFAAAGFHGTSTETIAERAGISQPYLFRLFGTKKELFLASIRRCFRETLETFQRAAEGKRGEEALQTMGEAYTALLADQTRLQLQMQAYAACDDPEICAAVRAGYGDLVAYVRRVSDADPPTIWSFFSAGMMLNVMASMGLMNAPDPWMVELFEGSGKGQ
jgi:AcrR family transcriptional regulator